MPVLHRSPHSLLHRALLAALCLPGLLAAGPLAAREFSHHGLDVGAEPRQVFVQPWQGARAIMLRAEDEGSGRMSLRLLTLTPDGLQQAQRWPLPEDTEFAEPVRLPGDETGWLLLVDGRWQLARAAGDALRLQPLCPGCRTVHAVRRPDRYEDSLVRDVDGDGVDEIVLAFPEHLTVYRVHGPAMTAEPVASAAWRPDGSALPREDGNGRYRVPPFTFGALGPGGAPAVRLEHPEELLVAPLPELDGDGGPLTLDGAALERSEARALPRDLQARLRALAPREFADAPALLRVVLGVDGDDTAVDGATRTAWAGALGGALAALRGGAPEPVRPYTVPFRGVGDVGAEDRRYLLGLEDMDGDGVPDALHATLRNAGEVLSQKNELRWYPGRVEDGRLRLAGPAYELKTDAGSFAALLHPRVDNAPPQALMVARAEVSMSSIWQALADKAVTVDISVLDFRRGGPADKARTGGEFTYEALREEGRRPMFLAADLNGDGHRDYILNLQADRLTGYLSAGGPPRLGRREFSTGGIRLPSRTEQVHVADLNGDGREELVLWFHPERSPGDTYRTIRVVGLR